MKPGRDTVVIAAGIAVVVFAAIRLYSEFNRRIGSETSRAVGTITYRYRVAQRRHSSPVVWENVEQRDTVFNRDTIRTDNLSEAIVTLGDGTKIELDPESMIVLKIDEESQEIEFLNGSIVVNPGTAGDRLRINNSGRIISDLSGRLRAAILGESMEITGSPAFLDFQGNRRHLQAGLITRVQGKSLNLFTAEISLKFPDDNERYFTDSASRDVNFRWERPDQSVSTIEIADDREFQKIRFRDKISDRTTTISLTEAIYYWRILDENGRFSEIRKFRIIQNPQLTVISPEDGRSFNSDSGNPEIYFSWNVPALSVKYRLEVSRDREFKAHVVDTNVFRNGITQSFQPGEYFWRLSAQGAFPEAVSRSPVMAFIVKPPPGTTTAPENKTGSENRETAASENSTIIPAVENLQLIFPEPGAVIDMSQRDSIPFRWKKMDGNIRYFFKLYNVTAGRILVAQTTTERTDFSFADLSKLDTGRFAWSVEASGEDGRDISRAEGEFSIVLTEQLEKPEFNIKENH